MKFTVQVNQRQAKILTSEHFQILHSGVLEKRIRKTCRDVRQSY